LRLVPSLTCAQSEFLELRRHIRASRNHEQFSGSHAPATWPQSAAHDVAGWSSQLVEHASVGRIFEFDTPILGAHAHARECHPAVQPAGMDWVASRRSGEDSSVSRISSIGTSPAASLQSSQKSTTGQHLLRARVRQHLGRAHSPHERSPAVTRTPSDDLVPSASWCGWPRWIEGQALRTSVPESEERT
jgi:hypothetical protein